MRNQQVGTRAENYSMHHDPVRREARGGVKAQNNGRNFAHQPVGTRANTQRIEQVAAQARHEVYVEPAALRSPYKGRTFHPGAGYASRESFCHALVRFFKIIFCCAC